MNDLKKVLGRVARNLVECSKPFVRWMDGSCIETAELRGSAEEDEPFVHNFFLDVSQNPQIVKTMLTLTHSIQKIIFSINRCAWWRQLWSSQVRQAVSTGQSTILLCKVETSIALCTVGIACPA